MKIFNNYLASIGNNLEKNIPRSGKDFIEYVKPVAHTFSLGEITPNDILSVIDSIKLYKAPGHDKISADVVKSFSRELLLPLKDIFRKTIKKNIQGK